MENEANNKIIALEQRITELENKLNSLFSISSFPSEIESVLIKRGFYNVGENELYVYYESGIAGKPFEEKYRIAQYREKSEYRNFTNSGLTNFYVNTTTNICNSPNHGFVNGQFIAFRTTDTLPGGLDSLIATYRVLNATADTYQVTTDGINPVNITSAGAGEQYSFVF